MMKLTARGVPLTSAEGEAYVMYLLTVVLKFT